MTHIYNQLYARGKGQELEAFIQKHFPHLILDPDKNRANAAAKRAVLPPKHLPLPSKVRAVSNASNLNKHGVFKDYRPGILTFPQKMIFRNSNPQQLKAIVDTFLKQQSQGSSDWLIIEDHAYVEFFSPKYATEANKIPKEARDIHLYRLKMMSKT